MLTEMAKMRPRVSSDPVSYVTLCTIRNLARRIKGLDAETKQIRVKLRSLVDEVAPSLLELKGVGAETASMLLVAAGDNPQRIRSEAAWAHLCGVAPIPASSGKTVRHRLNRGGDRRANAALPSETTPSGWWRRAMLSYAGSCQYDLADIPRLLPSA